MSNILSIERPPTMLILAGLPGSGKTHYAHEWVSRDPERRERVNYDDLRLELYGPEWVFNHVEERAMKRQAVERACSALHVGRSVVIDNTNVHQHGRQNWINTAESMGVKWGVYEMPVAVATCIERDRQREGRARVGRAVIERMALEHGFIDWNDGSYRERFVIVDIDGTLADLTHRRHFVETWEPNDDHKLRKKDWDSFFAALDKDTPIQPIFDLVRLLAMQFTILVVSGRGLEHAKPTEDWLARYWPVGAGAAYAHLFMRRSGDRRPDFEVKQELLDLLPPKGRIAYVLDDRNQVVDMWRKNGLTCLQVADGAF